MFKGDELYEVRTQPLEGSSNSLWSWAKKDTGAWQGPVNDWNTSHFAKYVEPIETKGVVVTAGGNMGLHTRVYSELFERVYVFEPDYINFHALVRNNFAKNVYFFKAAVGKESGFGVLQSAGTDNMGMHTVGVELNGHLPIMTIDQLNLQRCDLIQLDIEGGESAALLGAEETIKRHGPVVVTEGNSARKILNDFGYQPEGNSVADYIWRKK